MEAIKITLETLYDILRNEKKREDLQELEDTFFIDVVSYLREKQTLLDEKSKDEDIFAAGEKDKLEYELRSIKRILKEIYEKREKKMIDIALNKSRTGSNIIDTSAMLKEEKEFYENVLGILDGSRKNILMKLFNGKLPGIRMDATPKKVEVATKSEINEDEIEPLPEQEMTKVKFIHPTPSFVWKDMKVYGPYDIGEEIDIFPEVADLLVRKKRAEKV
jgi:DNA replication initiation complex subunit (GINS family)